MKRVLAISLVAAFAVVGLVVQTAAAKEKKMGGAAKQARWSGTITRSDKDAGTLTVRKSGGNIEKIVHVDSSTKWTKQEAGKVVDIDQTDVKDGDRVICLGTYDEKGDFHATRVDKRLPH